LPVIFERNKADFGAIVGDYCEKSNEVAAKRNQKNEIK
jgi:hypothetical protein